MNFRLLSHIDLFYGAFFLSFLSLTDPVPICFCYTEKNLDIPPFVFHRTEQVIQVWNKWINVENLQCELIWCQIVSQQKLLSDKWPYCTTEDFTDTPPEDNRQQEYLKFVWIAKTGSFGYLNTSIFSEGHLCHLGAQVSAPKSLYRLSNEFSKTVTEIFLLKRHK